MKQLTKCTRIINLILLVYNCAKYEDQFREKILNSSAMNKLERVKKNTKKKNIQSYHALSANIRSVHKPYIFF